ncbi:MAG: endopeptidase [Actinomycetota bacterium]|nr:endopeptidase [Actinomycetota bacterium]
MARSGAGAGELNLYRRLPADPRAWFTDGEIARAASYRRPLRRVGLAESLLGLALLVAAVATHAAARLLGGPGAAPWWVQVLEVVSVLVVAGTLLGLPFGAWRLGYERRWGFAHQTAGGWAADRLKELLVSLVLSNAAALGFFALVRTTPAWWLFAWAGAVVLSVVLAAVAPAVLAPLFNKFRPLDDPWLSERAVELGRRVGVRIRQVLVMDASRRTAKHNAYFTGLGRTKRVVLWDTLLADYEPSATLAVLAHELGHWRRRHLQRMLAISAAAMLPGLYALHLLLASPAVQSWAGIRGAADPAAVPVALLAVSVMQAVWMPVTLWLSRAWERQADMDALRWSDGDGGFDAFRGMQRDLAVKNLSDLAPSRWAYLLASHPPAAERMALSLHGALRGASGAASMSAPMGP